MTSSNDNVSSNVNSFRHILKTIEVAVERSVFIFVSVEGNQAVTNLPRSNIAHEMTLADSFVKTFFISITDEPNRCIASDGICDPTSFEGM